MQWGGTQHPVTIIGDGDFTVKIFHTLIYGKSYFICLLERIGGSLQNKESSSNSFRIA